MEVHHPHHTTHKKKWSEYLMEFLMLFLAVFLGFIAENIREHAAEKGRAKELLHSLVVDLKKDTTELDWLMEFRKNIRKPFLDSLYTVLNTPPEKIEKSVFYKLINRSGTYFTFLQSRGTFDQLKNAGYLRYFSDPQLLNYISDYDFVINDNKGDEVAETRTYYEELRTPLERNVDNNDAYNYFILGKVPGGTGVKPIKPDILENIKSALIQCMSYNIFVLPDQLRNIKEKATELLKYLHDAYKAG